MVECILQVVLIVVKHLQCSSFIYVTQEKKAGKTSVICSSGGNAGFAAAYASRKLDMPCVIFVPESTPQFMVERLNAEVNFR